MAFRLRTEAEIDAIAQAGVRVWRVLQRAQTELRPGLQPSHLEAQIREWLQQERLDPAMLGVVDPDSGAPFPAVCAVSVNEIAAHGVPSETALLPGDLVTLDLAASHNGWHADAAISVVIQHSTHSANQELAQAAASVTNATIRGLIPNGLWSEAVRAAWHEADRLGVAILPGFGGHGIGQALHELPQARFDVESNSAHDFRLAPGAVFTVEPIVTRPVDGTPDRALTAPNDWAVRTESGCPAACEERTVALTSSGVRVLTGPGPRADTTWLRLAE